MHAYASWSHCKSAGDAECRGVESRCRPHTQARAPCPVRRFRAGKATHVMKQLRAPARPHSQARAPRPTRRFRATGWKGKHMRQLRAPARPHSRTRAHRAPGSSSQSPRPPGIAAAGSHTHFMWRHHTARRSSGRQAGTLPLCWDAWQQTAHPAVEVLGQLLRHALAAREQRAARLACTTAGGTEQRSAVSKVKRG